MPCNQEEKEIAQMATDEQCCGEETGPTPQSTDVFDYGQYFVDAFLKAVHTHYDGEFDPSSIRPQNQIRAISQLISSARVFINRNRVADAKSALEELAVHAFAAWSAMHVIQSERNHEAANAELNQTKDASYPEITEDDEVLPF